MLASFLCGASHASLHVSPVAAALDFSNPVPVSVSIVPVLGASGSLRLEGSTAEHAGCRQPIEKANTAMKPEKKRPTKKEQPTRTPATPAGVTELRDEELEKVQGGRSSGDEIPQESRHR